MAVNNISNEDPMDLDEVIPSQQTTIDANVVVDQGVRGVKRSHRVAFECDSDGYGSLRSMKMRGYCGRRKPTLATAQPPQPPKRSSTLKRCLSRQEGDEDGGFRPGGAKRNVRFNEAVQTLWCSPHNIVGDDDGLKTTYVSEEHSPKWQAYLMRKAASKRDSLRKNLKSGLSSSCKVYMMSQNRAVGAEAFRESNVAPSGGLLLHPIFRCAVAKLVRPTGPTTTEVEVVHITNEELHRQAVSVIDAIVISASNHPRQARRSLYATLFGNNVDHEEVPSRVGLLAANYKKAVEDVFRCNGMLRPYHAGAPPPAVTDARKDDDWSEVHARAASLCKTCPLVSTVRAVEELLVGFKYQVDKLINA